MVENFIGFMILLQAVEGLPEQATGIYEWEILYKKKLEKINLAITEF